MDRRRLIWNTDERLLAELEQFNGRNGDSAGGLGGMVQRYRLLESAHKVAHVDIDSDEVLRTLRLPQVANWIERR